MERKTMYGIGNADAMAEEICAEVENSGMSCSLINRVSKTADKFKIHVLVFEKYFIRSSNRVSLTVVVFGDGHRIEVNVIGSGGGQGAIFKFSWGAEENFENVVYKFLQRNGFEERE